MDVVGWLRQEILCMDLKYRCVCYSLHASVIRQLPKLADAQTVGLVAETSLHLVTQASRVFLVHTTGLLLPVSIPSTVVGEVWRRR